MSMADIKLIFQMGTLALPPQLCFWIAFNFENPAHCRSLSLSKLQRIRRFLFPTGKSFLVPLPVRTLYHPRAGSLVPDFTRLRKSHCSNMSV